MVERLTELLIKPVEMAVAKREPTPLQVVTEQVVMVELKQAIMVVQVG